jgi:hypothetical protein
LYAFGCADPPDDEQMPQVYDECFRRYGVRPRGNWLPLSTAGGRLADLTNVIFSDGEKVIFHNQCNILALTM